MIDTRHDLLRVREAEGSLLQVINVKTNRRYRSCRLMLVLNVLQILIAFVEVRVCSLPLPPEYHSDSTLHFQSKLLSWATSSTCTSPFFSYTSAPHNAYRLNPHPCSRSRSLNSNLVSRFLINLRALDAQ